MHRTHVILLGYNSSLDMPGAFHSSASGVKPGENLIVSQSTSSQLSSSMFYPPISPTPLTARSYSMPSLRQSPNSPPAIVSSYSTTQANSNPAHRELYNYIMENMDKIPDNRDKSMHLGLPLPDDELESLLQMVRFSFQTALNL